MLKYLSLFSYQGVVTKHGEKDEVKGVDEALPGSTLRLDSHVHHFVPIFTGKNLEKDVTNQIETMIRFMCELKTKNFVFDKMLLIK